MSAARGAASGKVILLGEHTVVYGAPALAAGIERGARAEAVRSAEGNGLRLGGREHVPSPSGEAELQRAFAALLGALPEAPTAIVDATCELPPGGGLGSSAALGVAIARALHALGVGEARPERVLAAANAWEGVFHGNPSGIDTTAAMLGGCFRYTRQEGATPLSPRNDLWICVGSTGTSSSTRSMVDGVARLFERKPALAERSIGGITALVENAALAIEAGDQIGLGRLMDLNQMILAGMFVSTEAIEAMCGLAREAGALGAKLTGAGGGGSVIALVPGADGPDAVAPRVLAAWRSAGYDGFVTRVKGSAGSLGAAAQPSEPGGASVVENAS